MPHCNSYFLCDLFCPTWPASPHYDDEHERHEWDFAAFEADLRNSSQSEEEETHAASDSPAKLRSSSLSTELRRNLS
jgi:hypothetical protein